MIKIIRWLSIAGFLILSCAAASAAAGSRARQTTSASAPTSTASKKAISKKKRHHASKREPTQKAPTPDRISEIQTALARGGYYQGEPNGKWDANTVAAMQKFQSDNGVEPTGKLDAASLQKLGLGSDIAGVSPPKPVLPPATASLVATPPLQGGSATGATGTTGGSGAASSTGSSDAKSPAH